MIGFLLIPIAIFTTHYIITFLNNNSPQENAQMWEAQGKRDLKRLVSSREDRNNFTEYDESLFWNIIERINQKNDQDYRIQLQIFKLELRQLSSDEIVEVDNRILSLFKQYLSSELIATSCLIFKDPNSIFTLMSIFLLQGEVFFKQTCTNPDYFAKSKIATLVNVSAFDITSEEFYNKENQLIPQVTDNQPSKELQLINEKEYPKLFPNLWNKYI